jgi:uncharacterized integral membrane protein
MSQKEQSFFAKNKKEILISLIALLMLIFIIQNSAPIEFKVLFFKFPVSLIFLIALFYGMGMLTVWIKFYFVVKEKDKKIKELEERLKPQAPPLPPV